MLIIGETLFAGVDEGCSCGAGWLVVIRPCDDDDDDDDGGGGDVVDNVDILRDVSTELSVKCDVAAAVDDDGDDVDSDFTIGSGFDFFAGGDSSISCNQMTQTFNKTPLTMIS